MPDLIVGGKEAGKTVLGDALHPVDQIAGPEAAPREVFVHDVDGALFERRSDETNKTLVRPYVHRAWLLCRAIMLGFLGAGRNTTACAFR